MEEGTVNLAEIAFMVGYDDYTYFNRVFRKIYGLSPSEYRNTITLTAIDKRHMTFCAVICFLYMMTFPRFSAYPSPPPGKGAGRVGFDSRLRAIKDYLFRSA